MHKFLISFCLTLLVACHAAGATALTLKSARAVTAAITENADKQSVQISVRFIPVTSLNELTNARMNLVISRFFVEQALSQFYKKEKSVDFGKLKPTVAEAGKQKKTYSYVVPFSAISDAPAAVKKEAYAKTLESGYSRNSGDDLFLTASEIFARDLRLAEALFLKEIKETKDRKATVKNINAAFDALKKKVENQDDLLSAEKDEFTATLEKVRKYLLKKIRQSASSSVEKALPRNELDLSISRYWFRSDFKKFLTSDKTLLESGGCRAWKLPDGRIVLIGVGSVIADDSIRSRQDRGTAAENAVFAALAKHNGVRVTTFTTSSESTTFSTVDKNETAKDQRTITSGTTIRAEGYFPGMENVGHWYSPDGKLFFLAKGVMIPAGAVK